MSQEETKKRLKDLVTKCDEFLQFPLESTCLWDSLVFRLPI